MGLLTLHGDTYQYKHQDNSVWRGEASGLFLKRIITCFSFQININSPVFMFCCIILLTQFIL